MRADAFDDGNISQELDWRLQRHIGATISRRAAVAYRAKEAPAAADERDFVDLQ
jgi:hypothetical protein